MSDNTSSNLLLETRFSIFQETISEMLKPLQK